MRVDVSDIKLEAGSHKTVPVQVAVEPVEFSGQPVQFDRPFEGEAEIWNAGDRLLVRANLSGEALMQCSRCLQAFSVPLDVSFEEEFVEGADPNQGRSSDRDDEADDEDVEESQRAVTYFAGDEIDLSEPMRENVLLELPMKPLCEVDCRGLCASCGTNLNEGQCQCAETVLPDVDPRLAALKNLLRKPDSNS